MATPYIGLDPSAGPVTRFVPLSGSTASSPAINLTATVAASAQTIHTGDSSTQDVLYVTVSNSGTSSVTVYAGLGTLATISSIPLTVSPGTSSLLFNGNSTISKSGAFTMFSTNAASSGVTIYGFAARTFTATS